MTKSIRLWLLLFALVGGLLAAAACGGGGDDDDDGEEPTAAETMEDGDVTPADGDNGDTTSLDDFAAEFADQEMVVTYEFTSSVDGSSGSFVIYWKPPDRWRFDIISEDGGGTFLQTPDGVYICSEEEGGGTCLLSPAGLETIPLPFLSIFTDPGSFDDFVGSEFAGSDLDESSDNIAGLDATCYSASTDEGGGEVCFSSDNGIMLRITATDAATGDFTLLATDVQTSVSDDDLEPPYPVEEIPGF